MGALTVLLPLALPPLPSGLIPQAGGWSQGDLWDIRGQLVLPGQRGSCLEAEQLVLCLQGALLRALLSLSPALGQSPGESPLSARLPCVSLLLVAPECRLRQSSSRSSDCLPVLLLVGGVSGRFRCAS